MSNNNDDNEDAKTSNTIGCVRKEGRGDDASVFCILVPLQAIYWRTKHKNQKPQVKIRSLALIFYNEN